LFHFLDFKMGLPILHSKRNDFACGDDRHDVCEFAYLALQLEQKRCDTDDCRQGHNGVCEQNGIGLWCETLLTS